jgi:CDGSH-type Zn-finger protein
MTPMIGDFGKCGCGRSKDQPYCDGSHAFPDDEQLQADTYPIFPELPIDSDQKRNPYAPT